MPTGYYGAPDALYGSDDTYGTPAMRAPVAYLANEDTLERVVTIGWSAESSFPAGYPVTYEVERNGVVLGTTSDLTWVDPDSPTRLRAYRVRAYDEGHTSPWSNVLLVNSPTTQDPVGLPPLHIFINGEEVDCSNILAEIRIKHGTDTFTVQPTANIASMTFYQADAELQNKLQIGNEVEIRLGYRTRYFGRITDAVLTWERGLNDQTIDISAVGPIEHLAWNRVTGTRAQELDRVRMAWILTTVYGAQSWETSPGIEQLRAVEYADVDALDAAQDVCRSTHSRLIETTTGTVTWQDRLIRQANPLPALDVCWLGIDSEWVQQSEDVVNKSNIAYGPDDAEGKQAVETYEIAVSRPWLRRTVDLKTDLVTQADAYRYAKRLVDARQEHEWMLPKIVVPVHKTPHYVIWDLVGDSEIGRKVQLTGWPEDAPAQSMTGYIEGWDETITPDSWVIEWAVSAETISNPPDEWPLKLTATAVNTTSIRLDWNEGHPRVQYYEIYGMPVMEYLGTVERPGLTWTHSPVAMGSTHTYKLLGYDVDWNLIQSSNEATATTPAIGSADPITISYSQAHNGNCRLTWAKPADTDWQSVTFVGRTDRYPNGPTDGQGYSYDHTTPGTINIFGPGVGDRGDQYVYIRAYSKNKLGEVNPNQWAEATIFFLRSPVEFWPTVRNAYGVTYGWENNNRTRAGNTSSNTYRYIWCYGTQINDVMQGRKCTSIHVLMHRAGDGPGGGLQPRVGLHKYTSLPGGRPTIDGVQGWGGAFPRNYGDWVQISTDWGDQLSQAAGGYRGPGGGYDTTDINQTWVGQPASNDGVIWFRHSDYS